MGIWDSTDMPWRFTRIRLAKEFALSPIEIDEWSVTDVADALAFMAATAEMERIYNS